MNIADVRQQSTMNYLVRDQDVIFNLAGQVSHIDSMRDPYTDLEINCRSQLTILEACRNLQPNVKVVFAGTRQVYGRPDTLPVDEKHLVRPTDVNGINKAAGEYYHLVYNNVFGVRACSLRLTNVYGPRQLIKHNRQGFIGWFIRLALEDREIQIFGDGSQLRDFVYVDDAADAFLRAGATDACNGEVFNVGGDEPISHRDLVELLIEVAGIGVGDASSNGRREEGDRHRRASTPTRRSSARATGWMPTRLATGFGGRSRSTASTCTHYVETRRQAAVTPAIPFIELTPARTTPRSSRAIDRVIDRGWFVLGPEVEAFEARVRRRDRRAPRGRRRQRHRCDRAGAARAGIGAGDEVITPALSAAYTALAIDDGGRPSGLRRHRSGSR